MTSRLLSTMTSNSSVYSVAVSGDQNTLVSGHQDGGMRVWDVSTAQKTHLMPKLHNGIISSLQFAPDGTGVCAQLLLSASRDNSICLCDTRSFEVVRMMRNPVSFRMSSDWSKVSFSPDGTCVAAGSSDGSLVVWDTNSGNVLKELSGHHTCSINSVYWGCYGVMSCDKKGTAVLWI